MLFYDKAEQAVFDQLNTGPDGLTADEAEHRLDKYGRNELDTGHEIHPWKIFIEQFNDFLIYLLILAAVVSIGIGFFPGHQPEYVDAALIAAILLANGIFGFIQDYQAEKSIEALKDMSTPNATVLRDGRKQIIDSEEVVPGDIVFIEQGDAVPADARVLSASSLATDESALTGESVQVRKEAGKLEEDRPLAERSNMVFRNTTAVAGNGKAVVVNTGMETEVGSIAEQLGEADNRDTPFQEEVDQLGKQIGYMILLVIAAVAVIQFIFTNAGWLPVLMVAITLAVAAVPEGLPAVVTLSLALGSKQMLRQNALVRRLPVVESLGSVDVIVTDKTGTLTENEMTVRKLYDGSVSQVTGSGYEPDGEIEGSVEPLLFEIGALCNEAELDPQGWTVIGDPTEGALLTSARKAGVDINTLKEDRERVGSVPFDSSRKRMSTVHDVDGDRVMYMKGAPDVLLDHCSEMNVRGDETRALEQEDREEILEVNEQFSSDALRVLAFAYKDVQKKDEYTAEDETDLVFVGLQAMIDPPRDEVKGAVDDCRNAGMSVVMATGDNAATAKAVGDQVGFDSSEALTGDDIEQLSEEDLCATVKDVEVFARVSPEHKVRILQALQDNGHRVAMTGDGVNDAPALKNSDIGISMGVRGTDVAEQSSDMVLQDDNFVTIRDAVEQGRGIFDNIRKFVNYLLSANAGEVLVVFLGVLLGSFFFPDVFTGGGKEALILTPVMLLWVNLVTDGLPALALGADPVSSSVMNRRPRSSEEGVINDEMMVSIGGIGVLMAVTLLPLFFVNVGQGLAVAQTTIFTGMVVFEMVRLQIIRSRYDMGILSNPWILAAIASSILLQLLVLYTPLNTFFGVVPIGVTEWLEIGVAFVVFSLLNLGLNHVEDRLFHSGRRQG